MLFNLLLKIAIEISAFSCEFSQTMQRCINLNVVKKPVKHTLTIIHPSTSSFHSFSQTENILPTGKNPTLEEVKQKIAEEPK